MYITIQKLELLNINNNKFRKYKQENCNNALQNRLINI